MFVKLDTLDTNNNDAIVTICVRADAIQTVLPHEKPNRSRVITTTGHTYQVYGDAQKLAEMFLQAIFLWEQRFLGIPAPSQPTPPTAEAVN